MEMNEKINLFLVLPFELIGTDGEVGTKRICDGKVLKDGEMMLTQLVPGEMVAYDLAFRSS